MFSTIHYYLTFAFNQFLGDIIRCGPVFEDIHRYLITTTEIPPS